MRRDEFLLHMGEIFDDLRQLTDTKGIEYPQSDDQLANFKRLGASLDMPAESVLWVHLEKHLDGLRYYIKALPAAAPSRPVVSEPIAGRIRDAILYLILLSAIIDDARQVK